MADLNSMIAQGAQFQAPIDPFAQYGKMQQLQQYQNQNELARYTMAKAQQEDVTRNALNQSYQKNLNPETGEINYAGVYKDLAAANAGTSIPSIQKSQFDLAKEKAALKETEAKTLTANILNSRSALTGVNDQASYDAWRQDTVSKIPPFAKVIPLIYSPETHAALLSTSDELAKRMDVERQRLQRVAAMGGGAPAPAAAPATLTAPTPAPYELAPGAVPIQQGFSPGAVITTSDGQRNVVSDNKPAVTNNMAEQVTPVANQLAVNSDQTSKTQKQIDALLRLGDPGSIRAANVLEKQLTRINQKPSEFEALLANSGLTEAEKINLRKQRLAKESSHPQPINVSTKVNAYVPASETAQAEFMKEARTTYAALKNAQPTLDNIEAAKALVPNAKGFMGTGGEPLLAAASFLNNRLGTKIDTKGVTDATELRSRLFFGIIDNLKKLDSQPSQSQQAALQEALGNLGTDPNAIGKVLDAFGDSIRAKVDLHNIEMADAQQKGIQFPYNPVIKLTPKIKGNVTGITSSNVVVTPDGQSHSFPTPAAAAQFKKAAGL